MMADEQAEHQRVHVAEDSRRRLPAIEPFLTAGRLHRLCVSLCEPGAPAVVRVIVPQQSVERPAWIDLCHPRLSGTHDSSCAYLKRLVRRYSVPDRTLTL